jgi:HlyD family secretion protein
LFLLAFCDRRPFRTLPRMATVMDRPIVRPWWVRPRRTTVLAASVAAIGIVIAIASLLPSERTLRVDLTKVTIATVARGVYQDFIPLRGRVVPLETIYLDALEGGRVERVLVEPGDFVQAGQPLVELSNTELELTVLDREARLVESITQLQAYQTQLEQNRVNNEKSLAAIDYDIVRLERAAQRRSSLAGRGVEARETIDAIQDELTYRLKLRPLQARSNEQQEILRVQQVPQIRAQLEKLYEDIEITRRKLDNLTVRAPVGGRMTAIDLKVGENRNRGERFGEITPETGFKLSADVDEYYLPRMRNGQLAKIGLGRDEVELRVSRVYPRVQDGTFVVDLSFTGTAPAALVPGQTLQGKIALGNDAPALVLPNGAFMQTTGGDWIFALDANGDEAVRREVKLGRRNVEQVEVLNGLAAGERVIVSDYRTYEHIERIELAQ